MSGALRQEADAFLARFEGLRSQLPGAEDVRAAAALAFRAKGFPSVRDEAWKYTNLRPLADLKFREPLTSIDRALADLPTIPTISGPRVVFVDGRLRRDLSDIPEAAGFTAFAEAPSFGHLQRPEREAVVALNTMLAEDGASFAVAAGMDAGTIVLINLATDTDGRPVAFHPRHAIRLAAGARLTVIELALGRGVYLHNPPPAPHSPMCGCKTRRRARFTCRPSTPKSPPAGFMMPSPSRSAAAWRGPSSMQAWSGPARSCTLTRRSFWAATRWPM